MNDWKDILPKKGYGEWHIQWINAAGIWLTHKHRENLDDALIELEDNKKTWPKCQWRLHHYELNETIPGEILCL